MVAWPLTPPLQAGLIWRLIETLCFAICIFYTVRFWGKESKYIIGGFVFVVAYWFLNAFLADIDAYYIRGIALSIFLAYAIFSPGLTNFKFKKSLRNIIQINIILLIFWNIISTYMYSVIPNLTRLFTVGDNINPTEYGVSPTVLAMCLNFAQLYVQILFIPLIFLDLLYGKTLNRPISIIYLISVVVLVLNSGFSTAIICLSVVVVGLLFAKSSHNTLSFIFKYIAVFCVAYAVIDVIGQLLLDFVENPVIRAKLLYFFGPDHSTSYTFERTDLWLMSLNSFLEYPLGGGQEVGGHSAFLDFFGQYGLVAGIIFLVLIYHIPYKAYRKALTQFERNTIIIFVIILSLILALNPIQFAYGIAVFVFLPYFINSNRILTK